MKSKGKRRPAKPASTPEPANGGINQRELGERLGLTTRQIRNLTDEGMPRTVRGGKVEYPWPSSLHWYIEKAKAGAAAKSSEKKDNVWTRKAELEIQLSEIEVARELGQVVTLDYMAAQWEQMLFLLRARAVAAPTRWMDEFVGLPDAKAARKKLDELMAELLSALSAAGDDVSLDEIEDEDEPEQLEAAS